MRRKKTWKKRTRPGPRRNQLSRSSEEEGYRGYKEVKQQTVLEKKDIKIHMGENFKKYTQVLMDLSSITKWYNIKKGKREASLVSSLLV